MITLSPRLVALGARSGLARLTRPLATAYGLTVGGLLATLVAIAGWNQHEVPNYVGYDWIWHFTYAKDLAYSGHIPSEAQGGEYYTPPLFYAVFGLLMRLAAAFGAVNPDKVARALNVLLLLGTAIMVLLLARAIWPRRVRLQLAALAFFIFLPVTMKTASMFHPEQLSLFLSTLALTIVARMLVHGDFRRRTAAVLGLTLGAAQLVRAFTLWTFAVVILALGAAALVRIADRRRIAVAAAIAVAVTAVVTAPWYIRQAVLYSNPVFNRPTVNVPLWRRRPLAFYTALGLPASLSDPVRPNFTNDALPTVYNEVWGDYFGDWKWIATESAPDLGLTAPVKRQLVEQAWLGLVPTALAILGVLGLLAVTLRRRVLDANPAQLLVPLLPVLGILGFLYFTVSYPTPDGDVLKASYMLTTAPGWALAFGWAFARVTRNRLVLWGLSIFFAGCALADLGFLIAGTRLTGSRIL